MPRINQHLILLFAGLMAVRGGDVIAQESSGFREGLTPPRERTTLESILFDAPDSSEFNERIETDRREFTQSTTVIEPDRFQIESGYTFFRRTRGEEHESSHTFPETLLRVGVGYATEMRFSYNAAWQFAEEGHQTGSEDLRFSLKSRFNDQQDLIPQSAGILKSSVPTGSDPWSTDHFEWGGEYIYAWDIEDSFELYGSTGVSTNARGDFAFASESPGDDRFVVFSQSIAVGRDLTERIHGYAEVFGYFSHGLGTREVNPVFLDIGADYFVTNNFVIDTRFGVGLNDDADDFFCGLGAGWRF